MVHFKNLSFIHVIFMLFIFSGCQNTGAPSSQTVIMRATVSAEGTLIDFPADHPGLQNILLHRVQRGWTDISAIAPARVVACITSGMNNSEHFVLFESSDVASLYSQYRQSKSNLARAANNYARVKEMFANQTATTKDLSEAETDQTNAKASFAEFESRLRSAGFNPLELESVNANMAWLISDVPESELSEVQQGEDVDIFFSAFPQKKYTGHVASIGEVVDPVTRTTKVRVTIPNPSGKFIPGMFAKVEFGDPHDGLLLIPNTAVISVEGKDFVFLQERNGDFQRVPVIVQFVNDSELVAIRGIQDGDKVVIQGTMLLKGLSFGY